jgi:hypothetical protein
MKKLIAALALATAACAAPAFASDVGVSVRIGEPGFYGQLDVGNGYRPRLLYSQPIVVRNGYRSAAPVYLRVPYDHSRSWSRYCGRYDACARPVYFVRDDWYRNDYAPRYRQQHWNNWRDDRRYDRNDRYDHRNDWRDDHRGNRGNDHRNDGRNDHDRDHGNDHRNDGRDNHRDGNNNWH